MDVRVRTNLTKKMWGRVQKNEASILMLLTVIGCFFFLSSSLVSPTHLSFIGSAHIYLSTAKRIDNLDFFTVHTTALQTELR